MTKPTCPGRSRNSFVDLNELSCSFRDHESIPDDHYHVQCMSHLCDSGRAVLAGDQESGLISVNRIRYMPADVFMIQRISICVTLSGAQTRTTVYYCQTGSCRSFMPPDKQIGRKVPFNTPDDPSKQSPDSPRLHPSNSPDPLRANPNPTT